MLDFIFYGVVGFALAIIICELVRHHRSKMILATLALVVVLMPTLAFADDLGDAAPILAAIASHLPQSWATVFVNAIAVLGVLSAASSLFRGAVQPPSDAAPKWWVTTYKIASIPALDFGWARNVVLPGQTKVVQDAMAVVAKLAATNPSALPTAGDTNVVTLHR